MTLIVWLAGSEALQDNHCRRGCHWAKAGITMETGYHSATGTPTRQHWRGNLSMTTTDSTAHVSKWLAFPCYGQIRQTTNRWYFAYFFKKIGSDILCKLSPKEAVYLKCQILFSRKNKEKTTVCISEYCRLKFLPSIQNVSLTRT